MKGILKNDLGKIQELILKRDSFIISGHVNPDGDCIGACFSLGLSLKKMGKHPIIVLDDYGDKYDIIPGKELLYKGDISQIEKADVFIAVDCGIAERLGKAKTLIEKADVTVCIDHHISPKLFAAYNYIDEHASSSCALVFDVLNAVILIDKEIATALYAGIIYDTGGFRHSCTGAETHIVASKLIDIGIPFAGIYNSILRERSLAAAKMLSVAINRIQIKNDILHTYVTSDDLLAQGAQTKDLDEIVDYLNGIEGTEITLFVYERASGLSKASIRSKSIHICSVATELGGGGHDLAAGCDVNKPATETMEIVYNKLLELKNNG